MQRLVLDVLKPHQPNALEFAKSLAACGSGYRVHFVVHEVDEDTETVVVTITGDRLDFENIAAAINAMGASLHSIDEVEVLGDVLQ